MLSFLYRQGYSWNYSLLSNATESHHPPMNIEIRAVTPEDIPSIHTIYSASVCDDTASWELTPPDLAEMHKRVQAILDKGFPYFVAVAGTQVVGYSYASSYRERLGYRFTVEDSIYVESAHHGLGIGAKLLSALIDACTSKGYRQMVAVIGGSERIASIALHQKLGFARVGLLPSIGLKHGRWLDVVIMQRALGEGGQSVPET
jgi:phosphinothricin acetyltransferase